MSEYDVKRKAAARTAGQSRPLPTPEMTSGIPNSMLSDVFAGKKSATSDMMGRRSNLAPSIAAKMSQAFGMDVSGVQVYRSDAMSGSAMHGMASGNKVVLGSDVDLNTMDGQAILGHELSHIRAQSMGIGTGNSGLLQNAALEHQADAEGMMAARGMSISGESMGMNMGLGMEGVENLTPVGPGMSASAGAPMQAKKGGDKTEQAPAVEQLLEDNSSQLDVVPEGSNVSPQNTESLNAPDSAENSAQPRSSSVSVTGGDAANDDSQTLTTSDESQEEEEEYDSEGIDESLMQRYKPGSPKPNREDVHTSLIQKRMESGKLDLINALGSVSEDDVDKAYYEEYVQWRRVQHIKDMSSEDLEGEIATLSSMKHFPTPIDCVRERACRDEQNKRYAEMRREQEEEAKKREEELVNSKPYRNLRALCEQYYEDSEKAFHVFGKDEPKPVGRDIIDSVARKLYDEKPLVEGAPFMERISDDEYDEDDRLWDVIVNEFESRGLHEKKIFHKHRTVY